MKKIFAMIFVAAATLAGCQNVTEDITSLNGDKISVSVDATFSPESRAIISQDENGVYQSRWTENEYIYLAEVTDVSYGSYMSQSTELFNAGESAKFSFEMDAVDDSSSYIYVASTRPVALASNLLEVTLGDDQTQHYYGGSYDRDFDVLLSKAVELTAQPSEPLNLTMRRVNGALKLGVKNLGLSTDEEVESVEFACEQPIAGKIKFTLGDLAADAYPVPFEVVDGKNFVKTSFNTTADNFEVFYSCLPATLAAGDAYTVIVKTSDRTLIKSGILVADLTIAAGDITTVSVNMGDAASKTQAENLNPDYTYAIGFTTVTGNTYLLNRTATTKNPTGAEVSTLGLQIDAKGSIVGEVPEAYQWNYKSVDGKAQFYYITGSGNEAHLIMGNKAQGVAVLSKNENGEYVGGYDVPYSENFTLSAIEGGYCMQSDEERCFYYDETYTSFRGATGPSSAEKSGVVNFYRIQSAVQESLYPVITKAAHVTEGTYVIMHNINGVYNALKNDELNQSATAVGIADVALSIENGVITAAEVGDAYKWVITESDNDGYFQIRSWENSSLWVWHRNNSKGVAVCDVETSTGNHTSHWKFVDDASWGMQMNGLDDATSAHTRYARVVENATWGTLASPTGEIVLVKLSSSTDFKPQAE